VFLIALAAVPYGNGSQSPRRWSIASLQSLDIGLLKAHWVFHPQRYPDVRMRMPLGSYGYFFRTGMNPTCSVLKPCGLTRQGGVASICTEFTGFI
jgi:hypothetical protein